MSDLNERGSAFENKYAHDEEMLFKASARRNKLLGLWAAELLGKTGDAADAYAKEVIISDFEEPGDDDVLQKVLGDLTTAQKAVNESELRVKMNELMRVAQEQIFNEANI